MKTLQELQECYQKDLFPKLLPLEEIRKKVYKKVVGILILILVISTPFSIYFKHPFPTILGIVLWVFIYHLSIQQYVSRFKTEIIAKIISSIDPNLNYSKFGHIPETTFKRSKLFLRSPDEYDGDDLVTGKIGQTQLEFSEVGASYTTYSRNSGRQRHIIFKGLFIAADFNKHFKSTTVVLPDTAEKLFGHVGTFFQSMNKSRGDLVKLEDPEFEKHFAVYGQDQIESRYILSTSLMKRITEYKKKSGRNIYMSFVGSKIYVAISYSKDLFEPRVFKTVLDFKPIQGYYEDLKLAIDIVEDLNLNTRIWGK